MNEFFSEIRQVCFFFRALKSHNQFSDQMPYWYVSLLARRLADGYLHSAKADYAEFPCTLAVDKRTTRSQGFVTVVQGNHVSCLRLLSKDRRAYPPPEPISKMLAPFLTWWRADLGLCKRSTRIPRTEGVACRSPWPEAFFLSVLLIIKIAPRDQKTAA